MTKMRVFLSLLLVASFLAVLPHTVEANGETVYEFCVYNKLEARDILFKQITVKLDQGPGGIKHLFNAIMAGVDWSAPDWGYCWKVLGTQPACAKPLILDVTYQIRNGETRIQSKPLPDEESQYSNNGDIKLKKRCAFARGGETGGGDPGSGPGTPGQE